MVQTISVRAKLVPFLEMDWSSTVGGFASRSRAVHLGSERLDHPGEAFSEGLNIGLLGDGLQQQGRHNWRRIYDYGR